MSEGLPASALELLDKIRYDLTALQGKVSELKRQLAEVPLEDEPPAIVCPDCGPLADVRSLRRLMEHRVNVHGEGETPAPPPPRGHALIFHGRRGPVTHLDAILPPPDEAA